MASPPSPAPPLKKDVLLLFLCLHSCWIFPMASSTSPCYNSIISFGNSLADTGNFLISGAAADPFVGKLPYGITHFGHPTGRFSDGRLVVDFIAEAFGLPKLPPYLGGPGQDFRQGVNFAVAGATALDAAFFQEKGIQLWTNYSLSVQLRWFEELKPSLCHSPQECRDYLGKSLFLVGEIGGNDYNFPFFFGRNISEVSTYVPLVVNAIISATESLIQQGAVDLLVPGNLAIGCNAIYLTIGLSPNPTDYDPRNGCLKKFNSFSQYHNTLLKGALVQLQKKYPSARIMYADYYGPSISFANFPKAFGFTNGALTSCCGDGGPYHFNFSVPCASLGSKLFGNPSKFVNWDGAHMTEAAYHALAATLILQLKTHSNTIDNLN